MRNCRALVPLVALCYLSYSCNNNSDTKQDTHSLLAGKFISGSSASDSTYSPANGAILSFISKKYEFGNIKRKKIPDFTIEFEFENTGGAPLVILKSDVSCGCLSPEFSKQPIMPGNKGVIAITVDAKSQDGPFNKTIIVKSTAQNDLELLRITGVIK